MAAVDVVVQVERRSGRRRVRAIAGVRDGGVEVEWSSTDS
jgi:hypothetical protein